MGSGTRRRDREAEREHQERDRAAATGRHQNARQRARLRKNPWPLLLRQVSPATVDVQLTAPPLHVLPYPSTRETLWGAYGPESPPSSPGQIDGPNFERPVAPRLIRSGRVHVDPLRGGAGLNPLVIPQWTKDGPVLAP